MPCYLPDNSNFSVISLLASIVIYHSVWNLPALSTSDFQLSLNIFMLYKNSGSYLNIFILTGFLWHSSIGRKVNAVLLAPDRSRKAGLPISLHWYLRGGWSLLLLGWVRALIPLIVSTHLELRVASLSLGDVEPSDSHRYPLRRIGEMPYCKVGVKPGSPHEFQQHCGGKTAPYQLAAKSHVSVFLQQHLSLLISILLQPLEGICLGSLGLSLTQTGVGPQKPWYLTSLGQ